METKMSYDQFTPTRIMFGAGQLNNLHKQAMPGKKALIIISNGKIYPRQSLSFLIKRCSLPDIHIGISPMVVYRARL